MNQSTKKTDALSVRDMFLMSTIAALAQRVDYQSGITEGSASRLVATAETITDAAMRARK